MVNNTMRRAAAFLLCALTVAVSGGTLTVDPGTARIHAEALRATYPRPEGSPGEADAVQYITSVLTASGIEFERRSFAEYSGGHSFSTIIDVTIPGDGEDTLLIAVPLNHPEDADADSDQDADEERLSASMLAHLQPLSWSPARWVFTASINVAASMGLVR